ncbi:23S rRNA pseudouridine(2605) synthase RluB [Candidatus Hartigia pinicola]
MSDKSKQTEKIQKILARSGYGSRREIEKFLKEGRISINGKKTMIGDRIKVKSDILIQLGGTFLAIKEKDKESCCVIGYYKTEGESCTHYNLEKCPTVFTRLPQIIRSRWIVIGHLDINTSGIILFTTDGELANRLMRVSCEIECEYAVRVFGKTNDTKIRQVMMGEKLEDGLVSFSRILYRGGEGVNKWFHVTLTKGSYRDVRRLWEFVGVQVSRLIRMKYADIELPQGLICNDWMVGVKS